MIDLFSSFSYTFAIIVITVIISLLAWQNKTLLDKLIFYPPAINKGEWYRWVTHGFIHADSTHLLFNMLTLYFFGQVVEGFFTQRIGSIGFVVFYLMSIVVAMIPSYLANKNNSNYRSLGASGGVMAILFTSILNTPWNMLYIFGIVPIPAILFAIGYVIYSIYAHKKGGSKINHLAHLWGGAFGVIATIAIDPNIVPHFFHALLSPKF